MTTDEKVENDIGLAKGGNKVANQALVKIHFKGNKSVAASQKMLCIKQPNKNDKIK